MPSGVPELIKFESRPPSPQTAMDVFKGRWAGDLSPLLAIEPSGPDPLYTDDVRPAAAAAALGLDSFAGLHVLEIGPLEAAHTYGLERLGAAKITSVESSVEAWLKCLVVKELLKLTRSEFLLGDIVGYLEAEPRHFDVVFCSGVLYHMFDPVRLVRAIAACTDRCFVWTHVFHEDRHPVPFKAERVERDGLEVTYWRHHYTHKVTEFWGGVDSGSAWMTREDLYRSFVAAGLGVIGTIEDQYNHPNGPAVAFTACRSRKELD